MSWTATAEIKRLRENLTRSEKFLLLILADYHNEKSGQCNPTVSHLAEDILSSERRTQQLLTSLEHKGFIKIDGRAGGRTSCQYWLICIGDSPEIISPPTPEIISPQGRSHVHPTPEATFTPGAKQGSPEPSLEPSKENPHRTTSRVSEILEMRQRGKRRRAVR